MIVAQSILLLVIVTIFIYFMRSRKASKTKAYKKITMMLCLLTAMIAIVSPGLLTRLANSIGIGRGADLLLYMFVLVIIFQTFSNNLKERQRQVELHELARKIAILEANQKYKIKSKKT